MIKEIGRVSLCNLPFQTRKKHTGKARELADRWQRLSQIRSIGIKFALAKEGGTVRLF